MGTTIAMILLFLARINHPAMTSFTCSSSGAVNSAGACFLYNSTKLSYTDAKSACDTIGGVLAKVVNTLQIVSIPDANNKVWIGANDDVNEGTWVWEYDGNVARELRLLWTVGQPTNDTGVNCALVYKFEIYADDCESQYAFLCGEPAPDPVTSTSTAIDPATTNAAASITHTTATTPAASIPQTSTTPITTLLKCGANDIKFNVLLILHVCVFIHLAI
ncbi:unnamed protein product [Lymnaea stagnalis]|uniref:C-type lectin domain-containing protein n=1 Tax=Lymnaea stagnalis TaxID=6523 RepID=A0AAV2H6V0_LYMST